MSFCRSFILLVLVFCNVSLAFRPHHGYIRSRISTFDPLQSLPGPISTRGKEWIIVQDLQLPSAVVLILYLPLMYTFLHILLLFYCHGTESSMQPIATAIKKMGAVALPVFFQSLLVQSANAGFNDPIGESSRGITRVRRLEE